MTSRYSTTNKVSLSYYQGKFNISVLNKYLHFEDSMLKIKYSTIFKSILHFPSQIFALSESNIISVQLAKVLQCPSYDGWKVVKVLQCPNYDGWKVARVLQCHHYDRWKVAKVLQCHNYHRCFIKSWGPFWDVEVPKINFFGEQMQSHTLKLGFQTNDVLFQKTLPRVSDVYIYIFSI